jgi:hypothetical protein
MDIARETEHAMLFASTLQSLPMKGCASAPYELASVSLLRKEGCWRQLPRLAHGTMV